ncbi:hypothetical protein NJC40_00385 [Pseudomonas sp. 21LCFQ02]|uniref:tetratricopeptide repeat protein n=1 Tax=Pseudomonas sp. 21LCFQ02 TaxID=2957505 RepID=UPI00209A6F97|nr:hypothetical protein [Pseudomonas sp. 21LCFQ02]MCO8166238.1 hypothetical protein [Pseudomonas sp. 21LCFQ02]
MAFNGVNTAPITINSPEAIVEAISKSDLVKHVAIAQEATGDLETEFDRQIDHYKDQMNAGAIKAALESFEKLLADQKEKLSDYLILRVKINIALCKYQLGEVRKVPNLILEACTYAPEDKRAVAFKALAYILKGDASKALEYGREKIIEQPDNEILAAFILQATRIEYANKGQFSDPFEQFSERVKLNQSVRIAHIHLLASQEVEGWMDLAKSFLDEFPDDAQVKSIIASGILHHYINNSKTANGFTFTEDEVSELKLAANYLAAEWQEFKKSDRVAQDGDLQNIQNLLVLYKLSSDIEALIRECSYVLSDLADDQQLIEIVARSLIDLQGGDLFEKAVVKIADVGKEKEIRVLNKIANKDWVGLSGIQDYAIERFDSPFIDHVKVVVYIARAFVGKAHGKDQLNNLLESRVLDSRGRLLLFEFATASEVVSIAKIAHSYGRNRVTEKSEVIEFCHYMKLVRYLMLWQEIVSRLESHPFAIVNYELKHMLALGFLNEYPIRTEAIDFFEKHIIPEPKGFELLVGCLYFKRNDFKRSVPLIEKYIKNGGKDLFSFIVLCDIAKLSNDGLALTKLFDTYDLTAFDGNPEQRMHVAKVRASTGQGAEALADAYKIWAENPDSADVALGFFCTFIMVEKEQILGSVTVVSNGCYYRLVPSEGQAIEKNVEWNCEDILDLSPEKVDFYTRQVWGKGVGYKFAQDKLQGEIVWVLEEIKHPYLYAFHEICKNYETKFPNAGGLWSLSVKDNNFDSLLAMVQRQADWDNTLFGEILDKNMPLEVAAGLSKKGIFDVYDLVRSKAGAVSTCVGTAEDRMTAMRLVESYEGKPVILDTYAARVASELGLLESLSSFFSRVIVSHNTLQTLQMLSIDKAELFGAVSMENARILESIRDIESRCEVVEYSFPRHSDELTDKLVELNAAGIAPYFIAKDQSALFVTEDAYSRGFASHVYQLVDSVWIQAVLNTLLQRGFIDMELFSSAMLGLVERKHGYVSVGGYLLEYVYQNDKTPNLAKISELCEFIGGPHAELESHYNIIFQFILMRWLIDYNPNIDQALEGLLLKSHGDAFPSAKAMKATSMLLEKLIAIPGGRLKLKELIDLPIIRLSRFIIDWWNGHFYR